MQFLLEKKKVLQLLSECCLSKRRRDQYSQLIPIKDKLAVLELMMMYSAGRLIATGRAKWLGGVCGFGGVCDGFLSVLMCQGAVNCIVLPQLHSLASFIIPVSLPKDTDNV